MKKLLKKLLAYLNYISVSIFSKFHFRKQVKQFIKSIGSIDNDKEFLEESKKFWKNYGQSISTNFHKWYSSCNGKKDVRYIPEDVFYDKIERYYNNQELILSYSDKAMYKRLFPNINQPETIALNMNGVYYDEDYNIITIEEVLNKCGKYNEIVIKPTLDTGGGKNVTFINLKNTMEMKEKLKNDLSKFKKNFIIQEVLTQHEELKKINPESINTIRTISFFYKDNVIILDSILRMGINGSKVDNECSGGINCRINDDGSLGDKAFDKKGEIYNSHPQGFIFSKGKVPNYSKIKSIIINEHKKLPYFKIISWDFSIDENGNPVMIELNLSWQGLNFHQLNHGPLFGDLTKEVLDDVFSLKNKKCEELL
ncbi:hypothetical protein FDE77_14365 [Clostridium botulinum]|nr:hypothetical protein [Clostridium botulinum]